MNPTHEKRTRQFALPGFLLAAVLLGGSLTLQAENGAEEDLGDNAICLDCHVDWEQMGLLDVAGAQVHNPDDNSLFGEGHREMACIDCHADIQEIPHREGVERTVDCLACHEAIPE